MTRFHHNITIPEVYNHQVEEQKIIKFWQKEKIFEKLKNSRREKNDGKLLFHNAPVSSSGHPHSGHILNNLIKDVLKRYGYQKNFRVESTFRWDGHSRHIQYEVDRNLGITHPGELQKVDVKFYNEQCQAVAEAHSAEWKPVFERVGNCVDSTKQYSTSDTKYMEGVWRVFKQLYDKDLVYRDTKTLPYSTGCFTHLSNFEAQQNLKEVSEIGSTIALNIADSSEKLLIWTTNPWTLAFNSSVCLNPKGLYVKVKVKEQIYILSKNRLQFVFRNPSEYTVVEEVIGGSLADLKLEPLFENISLSTGYRIYTNSAVPFADVGTGIIASDEFAMESLKNGHILNTREVKYKKAHCLRSGIPLISKRVESWFVRVEDIAEDLQKNISFVSWLPKGSEKNLINWLKEHLADWSISRSCNWGTPLPIWSSESGDEIVCIGSLEELKRLSGKRHIPDLHREVVDWIRIPSKVPGNPPLRRVGDVFDCWFESSVLPFIWKESDQADIVAEGIDQTQGWFYTTLVLATALSQPPPFRNVFAHGLTLEHNGSKVDKRKHNHNDPMRLCEKYGADALRLYLLHCSDSDFVVEEKGVAKMAETVIQPLYRIFFKCTSQMGCSKWINYGYVTEWYYEERDPIDRWILSCTESVLKIYIEEMNAYQISSFLPKVIELVKQIEEWYIPLRCSEQKLNHKETEVNTMSTHRSTIILFNVIYRLCLVLAPVAPFLTEFIYQIHKNWMVFYCRRESMHEARLIEPNKTLIKPDLELIVQRMQNVVKIVGQLRAQHGIPIQYQIQEVVVIHHSEEFRQGIASVKNSFVKLMNAHDVRVSDDYREFGVSLRINLRENSNKKKTILKNLNEEQLDLLIKGADLGAEIQLEEIVISYEISREADYNCAIVSSEDFIVVMKMNKSMFFYEEGTVKELVHQISNFKKKNNFYRSDCVVICYSTEDDCLKNVIAKRGKHINQSANCDLRNKEETESTSQDGQSLEERLMVKGASIKMYLDVKCE